MDPDRLVINVLARTQRVLQEIAVHRSAVVTALSAVTATATVGGVLTTPNSPWYRSLRKPTWQPPGSAFAPVWTVLYGLLGGAAADTWDKLPPDRRAAWVRAVAVNLLLNASWNATFFRAHRLRLAAIHAGVLEASTLDLIRRSRSVSGTAAAALVPYAIWGGFAFALNTDIARRNPHAGRRA
jgi:tryptophan-rich sensory protein